MRSLKTGEKRAVEVTHKANLYLNIRGLYLN